MKRKREESDIYEAALKAFARFGYKKTTLEAIAAELDMTAVNLYCYAESKQSLYHDSVAYAMTKWQNKVVHSLEATPDDPVVLFKTLCENAIMYLSEDDTLVQILRGDPQIFPMFPTVDPYEDINRRSFEMLRSALALGMESGIFRDMDTDRAAMLLFDIYKGLIIETYIINDNPELAKKSNEMIELIMYGLIKR